MRYSVFSTRYSNQVLGINEWKGTPLTEARLLSGKFNIKSPAILRSLFVAFIGRRFLAVAAWP